MKTKHNSVTRWILAVCALPFAILSAQAQSYVLVNAFANADEVADTANGGANAWQNWYGTAFYQAIWDSSDASNNVTSGSLRVEAYFPDAGIGGQYGPQFLAIDGYNGIQPPLPGNGNSGNVPVATNVSFDIRFDPATDPNGSANWPTIEVGTRGQEGYTAYTFGTVPAIPVTQTNWVHVNIPIGPSANWTNITHIFFKHYSGSRTNWVYLYLDNIIFTTSTVQTPPPTLTIKPAKPALRIFAGNSQYTRTQVATVDTNQSWVGGTYPVTYSFTLSDYDINPSLNELHMFLTPLNYVQGGGIDQYTDYSTASNNLRLQIVGTDYGTTPVVAQISFKTNAINANPSVVVASLTNNTAIGTWTVSFSSATAGTLTAPGASPIGFSLPADVAATFANPLVAFFGVQANDTANLGQQVDFTKIQTANVASPGVAVNTDFTTGASIDTNIWRTASVSDSAANLVIVDSNHPWWLNWGFPDIGFALATKADLGDAGVAWKTPAYYTGYDTNNPVSKKTIGTRVSALIPKAALPTVDGVSNGVPGNAAYFRLSNPAPAQ